MPRAAIMFAMGSLILVASRALLADGVVLVNGDRIHGEVISLDKETLTLHSEHLGELSLQRDAILSIHLGEIRLPPPQAAAEAADRRISPPPQANAASAKSATTPEELITQMTGKAWPGTSNASETVSSAIEELRAGGLSRNAIEDVQQALPLLNTPEARDYFNTTVSGLVSGQLDVQDIRKDAMKARDTILDLKKDLGPGADALNGYLSILNGFIDETQPPAASSDNTEAQDTEADDTQAD